jgi:hypothetical protein
MEIEAVLQALGNVTTKHDPRPSMLLTVILPPWA